MLFFVLGDILATHPNDNGGWDRDAPFSITPCPMQPSSSVGASMSKGPFSFSFLLHWMGCSRSRHAVLVAPMEFPE